MLIALLVASVSTQWSLFYIGTTCQSSVGHMWVHRNITKAGRSLSYKKTRPNFLWTGRRKSRRRLRYGRRYDGTPLCVRRKCPQAFFTQLKLPRCPRCHHGNAGELASPIKPAFFSSSNSPEVQKQMRLKRGKKNTFLLVMKSMAEGLGFEPRGVLRRTPVFGTGQINHSCTPP